MTKSNVTFKFDKEKDLYNIWETCNKNSSWHDFKKYVSPDLLKICENKELNKCKKKIISQRKKMYRSEEHTSELQSHSFISYAVFCLKKKKK